jgi:hypothetical protein
MGVEFLTVNLINTTTQIAVNSNTSTAENLFARDPFYQYYSTGFANDNTSSTITITFDETTPVSRIALLDTNFKNFYFYYNGATANSFNLVGADTTTSSYTANADENKYFRFDTIMCSSITVVAKSTQVANQEKRLGLLVMSDLQLALTYIPAAGSYKPKRTPKQITHKLADGGTRIHNVRSKWDVQFSLDYIPTADRDALYELHSGGEAFNYCPFGTSTGWDGIFFEAVWPGPFDFFAYSDNAGNSGFSGKVTLAETPS